MRSKREKLKSAAMDLFKRFGMKKVTIKEICEHAQTSKVTFYKHYRNKIELIGELLKELYEYGFKEMTVIWQSDLTVKHKFHSLLELEFSFYDELGPNFLHDLMYYSDIQQYNYEMSRKSLLIMYRFIRYEQKKGTVRKDLKSKFMISMFSKAFEIMKDPVFQAIYPDPKDLINAIIELFVFGVVNET